MTVSVGVAAVGGSSMQEMLQLVGLADDALYTAKRQGRNRVISASDDAAASR